MSSTHGRLRPPRILGLKRDPIVFDSPTGCPQPVSGLKRQRVPATSPATIILNDNGKKAAANDISDRLNRGEQVLVVNLLFTEDASPNAYDRETFVLMLATIGQRAIGIEGAQLIALGQWLQNASGSRHIRLESDGIRSQITALIASGLGQELFSPVVIRDGMRSFQYLLDKPVPYQAAPDLFCLDLYNEFDIDYLAALAQPALSVQREEGAESRNR